MLYAAVGCLCAAVATAALGVWTLSRPRSTDLVHQVLRAVAPTQLAAAAMLAVAGVVALAQPANGAVVVVVCVLGAIATVGAGCWQSAKFVAARAATAPACASTSSGCGGGACATCTFSRAAS
jgi:hypothetical protein